MVEEEEFARIREAADEHGLEALKPIYEALDQKVSYGKIRMGVAMLTREGKLS